MLSLLQALDLPMRHVRTPDVVEVTLDLNPAAAAGAGGRRARVSLNHGRGSDGDRWRGIRVDVRGSRARER
jgi:hypothetical protein